MSKQWILVANGSLARFFSTNGAHDPWVALETVRFPEGRSKASEIGRDRQGREHNDRSSAATHFEPRTSVHKKMLHRFAHDLAQRLEDGLADGEYETLGISASSPFLSELKAALSTAVTARLRWVQDHDFTGLDMSSIENRLRERLSPAR